MCREKKFWIAAVVEMMQVIIEAQICWLSVYDLKSRQT